LVRPQHDLGDQCAGGAAVSVLAGTFAAAGFIAFLTRLVHDAEHAGKGPVFGIVDGHPVHRAQAVTDFVTSTGGALRLYRLPAYSPQLNPDEWVWNNVKHDGVAPAAPKGPEQLKATVETRLRPGLVQSRDMLIRFPPLDAL
jgi:transposase